MTAILTPTPWMQFIDANGNPLVGGKLYTYASGTTTPLATYTDAGALTPNTNPVILNSAGEASVWLGASVYTFVLTTATDALVWTANDIMASATVSSVAAVAADLQAFIDLMASPVGSAEVGYMPGGAGVVATTVQGKLRETASVKDFGAVGNGTHDDTAAIVLAFTAGVGYFPNGTYKITAPITVPVGLSVSGEDRTESIITCAVAGNMFIASYTGSYPTLAENQISNLTFVAGIAGVTAIHFSQASHVDIDNCSFFGFATCVYMSGGWFCTITNCRSNGINSLTAGGLYFTSPKTGTSSNYIFWLTVDNFNCSSGNGASFATGNTIYLERAIGANIRNVHLNGSAGGCGIRLYGDCQGCVISSVHVADNQIFGMELAADGADVPTYTEILDSQFDACTGAFAVVLGGSSYTSVQGCNFTANAANGIALTSLSYANISNNIFSDFAGSGQNALLLTDAVYSLIQGNFFIGNETSIAMFGTCTHNNIDGNQFVSVTNPIAGAYAATGNVMQSNNSGFSRTPFNIAPAVPASGVPYTNASGFPLRIFISGGTVTNVYINSAATGATQGMFTINVDEYIVIIYSVAPTAVCIAA